MLLRRLNGIMRILRQRPLVALVPCMLLALALFVYHRPRPRVHPSRSPLSQPHSEHQFDGSWTYERDRNNLLLTQGQCDQAFPHLFADIDRARDARSTNRITLQELDSIPPRPGYIRAMIYDQQLYIIASEGSIGSRGLATLAAINRAVMTSPEPLSNIEFAFNTDDRVDQVPLWGYSRRHLDETTWLIPDFGFWSWPEVKAGSTKEAMLKAEQAEHAGLGWAEKTPKLLWRGAPKFGVVVRDKLLEVTKGKSWGDVKALDWKDPKSLEIDYKSMPQHCEYKYLAQTEGNAYSGRLKYLQMCRSVVVSHKMDWVQHYYHLLRSSGSEQNFVEVERDWSDLDSKMKWLLGHDDHAQRIADNNVKTFRERYLTPAAETCYWRRLVQEWAKVSFEPNFFHEKDGRKAWRGVGVESFLLMRSTDWHIS